MLFFCPLIVVFSSSIRFQLSLAQSEYLRSSILLQRYMQTLAMHLMMLWNSSLVLPLHLLLGYGNTLILHVRLCISQQWVKSYMKSPIVRHALMHMRTLNFFRHFSQLRFYHIRRLVWKLYKHTLKDIDKTGSFHLRKIPGQEVAGKIPTWKMHTFIYVGSIP